MRFLSAAINCTGAFLGLNFLNLLCNYNLKNTKSSLTILIFSNPTRKLKKIQIDQNKYFLD